MAGGIDWFRWHHGSVTDPKFQLVARKSGARLSDVLAVWAFLLEQASESDHRGTFGDIDAESIDCLFGFDDGLTASIVEQMGARGLVDGDAVSAWEKRQPKREDDTAAERKRRQRERDHELQLASGVTDEVSRNVTQRHAQVTHGHDRGEESREEKKKETPLPPAGGVVRFEDFWSAWPANERKQDKVKCAKKWKVSNLDLCADAILADIAVKQQTNKWQGGFVEAPLVYLNGKRWEDGVTPAGSEFAAPNSLAGAI